MLVILLTKGFHHPGSRRNHHSSILNESSRLGEMGYDHSHYPPTLAIH